LAFLASLARPLAAECHDEKRRWPLPKGSSEGTKRRDRVFVTMERAAYRDAR
jgi:hypothetical protein